jgi:hypothetical protein
VERLGLHLDQRELDVVLDVGLGRLGGVQHPWLSPKALTARTSRMLDLAEDLPFAAFLEDTLQLRVPHVAFTFCIVDS